MAEPKQETVLNARQVYQWIKSGTPAIVKEAENLLRAGKVKGVTKGQLEANKDEKFAEFITKWKLPITEGGRGGGGTRGGILVTAKEIFGEGTSGYNLAKQYHDLGQKLQEALEPKNRSLSPGYIRGEEKEKPADPQAA